MSFRIASFNLENLGYPDEHPQLDLPPLSKRIGVLRPQLRRLEADILCFQEVHGKDTGGSYELQALKELLEETRYSSYSIQSTTTDDGDPHAKRNLVVVSRPGVRPGKEYHYTKIDPPRYRILTAESDSDDSSENDSVEVKAGRPFFHVEIELENGQILHLINLHLKSRSPTDIEGQNDDYKWFSVPGWAEGYFLSSMKRVSQAIEARMVIDDLLDQNKDAKIVVCGDFNAPPGEVPVEAIIGRVRNTSNAKLVNRELIPCGSTVPKSERYTYLYHGEKRLLDHMVVSRGLIENYREAEIHNELLRDETTQYAFEKRFPESDHAPFVGVFDFEE